MSSRQNKLLQAVEACACLGLFIWLRWYSSFWRYSWTGLILATLFGLFAFQGIPAQQALAKHNDIPRRVYVLGAVGFLLFGFLTLKRFLMAGKTDDGFFGILMLALGLQQAIIYLRLSRRTDSGTGTAQSTHINHG